MGYQGYFFFLFFFWRVKKLGISFFYIIYQQDQCTPYLPYMENVRIPFVHQTGEAYNKAETNFRGQLQHDRSLSTYFF